MRKRWSIHTDARNIIVRFAKLGKDSLKNGRGKRGFDRVETRGERGTTSMPFNPLDYDLKGVTRVWSSQIAGGPLVNVFELIHVCVAIRFMRTRPVRSSLSTDGARRPRQTPAPPRGMDDEDTFYGEFRRRGICTHTHTHTQRERCRSRNEARGINPAKRSRAADVLYNRNRDFIREYTLESPSRGIARRDVGGGDVLGDVWCLINLSSTSCEEEKGREGAGMVLGI